VHLHIDRDHFTLWFWWAQFPACWKMVLLEFLIVQAKRTYHGFGFSGDSFQFAVFDDYVKFNSIKKLTSETINSKVTLYDFIVLNNKMYMFYTMSFPERDEFSLYVNEVDKYKSDRKD
jgi:hypothetical protein